MEIEGVVLTGGRSRRMGCDKASLLVEGLPLAERVVAELEKYCASITVLGPYPIRGRTNVVDDRPFEGPLAALAGFCPSQDFCFVAACDMPFFDGGVVPVVAESIGPHDAAIPMIDGRLQPLCGLYRASAWISLRELYARGERRMMTWLDRLNVKAIDGGIDLESMRGVNTPEQLASVRGPGNRSNFGG